MKSKISKLILKNGIILFVFIMLLTSYMSHEQEISIWIRENIYKDSDAEGNLYEDGETLIDKNTSKFNPLFVYYQEYEKDGKYAAMFRYISNTGDIFEYTINSDVTGAPEPDELLKPDYIKAMCTYRAKIDEAAGSISNKEEMLEYYGKTIEIEDRTTYEHAIIIDSDDIDELYDYDVQRVGIVGFTYHHDEAFLATTYYNYTNGVAQKLKDKTATEIFDYIQNTVY